MTWTRAVVRNLKEEKRSGDLHRHSTKRLKDPEEGVGMKEQATVGQALLSYITWRAGEQTTFWWLQAHAQRGKDIRLQSPESHSYKSLEPV